MHRVDRLDRDEGSNRRPKRVRDPAQGLEPWTHLACLEVTQIWGSNPGAISERAKGHPPPLTFVSKIPANANREVWAIKRTPGGQRAELVCCRLEVATRSMERHERAVDI